MNSKNLWQLDYELSLALIKEKQALKCTLGIIPDEKFIFKNVAF